MLTVSIERICVFVKKTLAVDEDLNLRLIYFINKIFSEFFFLMFNI